MHTQQNGGKHMIAEVLFGEIEPWQKNMMSMNQIRMLNLELRGEWF